MEDDEMIQTFPSDNRYFEIEYRHRSRVPSRGSRMPSLVAYPVRYLPSLKKSSDIRHLCSFFYAVQPTLGLYV